MVITSTMMTPPTRFLVASVWRVHMLSRMLGHVVLHHELVFLFRRNKLLKMDFDFLVHGAVIGPYNLHIPIITSNISESLFLILLDFVKFSSFEFSNVISSSKPLMVKRSSFFS